MGAVTAKNLTKVFVSKIGTTYAVKELNLNIKPNNIYGLIGHNGAGKTTTFMLLNTLLEPTAGSGQIFGLDLIQDKKSIRRATGFLSENLRLYNELTVVETLQFFADLYGTQVQLHDLLERFELTAWSKQQVGRLSTGMRKKVAILSACIHQPRLLFLDEPFSGLDPLAMQGLRDFITYLLSYNDMTVIIASHNLKELASLCHEVGIMKDGQMIASGTLAAIKEQYGFMDYVRLRVDDRPQGLEQLVSYTGPDMISVDNRAGNLNTVLQALARQEIRVLDIEVCQAALEDIYQRVYEGAN